MRRARPRTGDDKDLDGNDNKNVIDVETRVTVVEREEPVHRELGAQVVVLAGEHLFAHARADFGLEVENRAESKVTTLSTL
jgi:hypothetical protein